MTLTTYYTCAFNVLYRIKKGRTLRIVQLCDDGFMQLTLRSAQITMVTQMSSSM
jgi:hypothetical protein